ncbi:MAG: hypothetical protein RL045_1360 [Bacteroidota bacterium]|jgi:hypothetical protein
MATPNIYLHFWNDSSASITFQEVIAWEVPTPVIEAIQIELLAQLTSERASEAFPNFPWASPRFEEKWAGIAQTLLYQVSLPEFIWKSWIEDGSFPAAETPAEPFDLLNTEVYFEAPESLEDSSEEEFTRLKDLLSGSSDSLKAKVESQMTLRIADTIPLHQRIKFIQELFQGDVAQLESLIQYIDEEAEAETWSQALLTRFAAYRAAENEAIWEELHSIIQRKFN